MRRAVLRRALPTVTVLAAVLGSATLAASAAAVPYPGELQRDAPRAHWRLGETSGTVAADRTGTASGAYRSGVVLGVPGAIASDPDGAAQLDGSNDVVGMGDPATGALDLGVGDFTVELWLRTTSNKEQAAISKQGSERYWNVTVTDDPGHVGHVRAKLADGVVTRQAYGPPLRVDDGAWHHVAVVFDRDTGIAIHVDGAGHATPGAMPGDVSNTAELLLGKASGYPYFKGGLDEAALYPAALPDARVRAHHDAGRGGGGAEPPPDTVAPDTAITAGPVGTVATAAAAFSLSSEPGAAFECRLDGAAWAPCGASPAFNLLADGAHVLHARAKDVAGNVDASPAAWSWSVDTTAPDALLTSGPSGLSASAAASFTFVTAELPGEFETVAYECRLDGGTWQACSSPVGYAALGEGPHSFDVRARDGVGNVDATPAARVWSVDTTAPDTTIAAAPALLERSATASFELVSEAGAAFECRLDGGSWTACSSSPAFAGLADGAHSLDVRAADATGNVDPSAASWTWTVDTAAPDTSITGGPAAATSAASASVSFSSEDGAGFECRLDGAGWAPCSSPAHLAGLEDGSHSFAVRAIDAAGNADPTPAARDWTVDTTAPQTAIDSGPAQAGASPSADFAFSSEPGAAFECRLDGGAWEGCASPATFAGLSDGPHSFDVRAGDEVGNADATPATRAWTVDTTPPETTITAAPALLERVTTGSFALVSEAGAAFECRLDGGSWEACGSSPAFADLADGAHSLDARAVDAVGNADPSPAAWSWAVDTAAPDTAIADGPAALTRSTAASFSFSSEDGAGFECRLDDGEWALCSSPAARSGLPDGDHLFRVRAIDAAGNVDTSPASWAWNVDTVAPVVSLEGGPEGLTSSADASFSLVAELGARLECRLDEGAWAECASPAGYAALADGEHAFEARAVDAAGNIGAAASRSWRIDTQAPDTLLTSGPEGLTGSAAASFTFVTAELPGEFETVAFECDLDTGTWEPCSSPAAFAGLADGSHDLAVRAVDTAGNADPTPAERAWTVDTTPPQTAIDAGPDGVSGTAAAEVAFSAEAGSTFECRLDGGAWTACVSPAAFTGLADGPHSVEVRATDPAGNLDPTPAARGWTVNSSTAPDTSVSDGPSGTGPPAASFAFAASGAAAGFECRLDGGAWEACSSPQGYSGLLDGPHAFEVRAISGSGSPDPTPASRTWAVDATAPDTRVTGGPPNTTALTSASVSFTTAERPATYECRLDGAAWDRCTSPAAASALADGIHRFDVRAADALGNADPTPAVRTWTVDTMPPETTIDEGPSGLVTTRSATLHFTSPDAPKYECRLDGAPWAACPSRVSYSSLPDGSHTFEARAKDPAGNLDPTPAARTWAVDATPPDTSLTSAPAGTTASGPASLSFSSSETGATFECRLDGSAWAPCTSPKAYGTLVDGEHRFDVRARDLAGGTDASPASASWTTDALPPPAAESHLPAALPESTGNVFHVAPTGSNANPGTVSQPWLTVQKAVDALQPGQTALVHAGTYTQRVDVWRACGAAAPCTIEAAPGEPRPVLRHPTDHVVRVSENGAHWRFRGLTFRDSDITSGGVFDIHGHHIELSDSEVTNSGDQGIYLEEGSHHVQLLRNWIHNSGLGRLHQSHGIYLQGDDHLVAGNVIHDHPFGFGIQVYDHGVRAIVVNNTITHNGWSGVVAGGAGVSGAVIRNNVLAYNGQYGISWDASCPNDSVGTTIAEHNVIYGNVRGVEEPSSCSARSVGAGNRTTDPRFADVTARDLHLLAGSPALGYALPSWTPPIDRDGDPRPQGGAPDTGAYESG